QQANKELRLRDGLPAACSADAGCPRSGGRNWEKLMRCPACDTPNPPENQCCQHCVEKLPPSAVLPGPEDLSEGVPAVPVSPPKGGQHRPQASKQLDDKVGSPGSRGQEEDNGRDVVLTLIPYKNPKALAAYYCGFFALIPVLGFILGAVAMVLGI